MRLHTISAFELAIALNLQFCKNQKAEIKEDIIGVIRSDRVVNLKEFADMITEETGVKNQPNIYGSSIGPLFNIDHLNKSIDKISPNIILFPKTNQSVIGELIDEIMKA